MIRRSILFPALALAIAAGTIFTMRNDARAIPAGESDSGIVQNDSSRLAALLALRDADIAFYEKRAAEDPWSAADRAQLAGLWLQRGRESGDAADYRRAEAAARGAVELRENRNGKARLALASSLLALHRFEEALEAASALVQDEPDIIGYRALLAEIQMELGRYEEADASFRALYHARRDLAVAPRLARWFEIKGEPAKARRILDEALAVAKRRSDLPAEQLAWFHLRVADHAMRFGRLREAKRVLDAGLRAMPEDGRLLAAHARLAALRGRWRESLRSIERAGSRADIATLALAGDAWAALGDPSLAEQYYSRAEAAYASNPEPFARQWTQFRLEHRRHIAETLELLKREIAVRPDVLGWDLLAWAYYQAAQPGEAERAITRALRMDTRDATLLYHAGMIQRALGRSDSSRVLLARALQINRAFHPLYADSARRALKTLRDLSGRTSR